MNGYQNESTYNLRTLIFQTADLYNGLIGKSKPDMVSTLYETFMEYPTLTNWLSAKVNLSQVNWDEIYSIIPERIK